MSRLSLIFSHNSIVPMICALLAGIIILVLNGSWWGVFFVFLGIPAQMLNEYSLHRFIFHLPPPEKQRYFNVLYQAHYGHHDFPTNRKLFFAPIWVSIPVLIINFTIVWALLWLVVPQYALSLAASIVLVGGVGTFLCYEWFHMTAHLPVNKNWVERHVTTLHNQHHFRDFSKWFHVSPGGQIIDKAMGTAIDRETLKKQQRVEFIRTLGMRPDDERLIKARHHFSSKYGLSAEEIERAGQV
ncbi:sterol desaturase family protein [Ahrensia marina]|uniref:Fatty acid hydroxylase n=1 Tax=Ahrensia marina TaxID=1514904 RepID=A0A0N0E6W7_9HYPH|nr:sterol desaturase family protein [Ahrensia marina]KPB00488.1 fatty acid hydroxylase [Ahrensia marina]